MKKMKKKKKKMKGEMDSGIACEVGTIKETVNMCELDFFFFSFKYDILEPLYRKPGGNGGIFLDFMFLFGNGLSIFAQKTIPIFADFCLLSRDHLAFFGN